MTSGIDKLLDPISAENDCGEDISYDPAYQDLEKLLLGKPETQFSAGEPPNWLEIRQRSIALLERSKHLRVVVALVAALVRTEGLPGFRDGLTLLRGLMEKYWANLYPRLDPEDRNDPTERVNIIASIAAPMGTAGDPFKVQEALRACPLTDSPTLGRFSLEDIANIRAGVKPAKGKLATTSDVEGAFRDTSPATITTRDVAVGEAVDLLKAVQQKLDELAGLAKTRDLSPALATLGEVRKQLSLYLPQGAPVAESVAEGDAASVASPSAETEARGVTASIENRQHVVQALDLICNYYARYEPSSPVPLLLQRARRLVELDFLGILADLSPETLEKARSATGAPK